MKTLEKNAINVWGSHGQSWFNRLPEIIFELSKHWNLSHIVPVDNMTYNYVAKAIQADQLPVVLKISCDRELIQDEYRALNHFKSHGAIKVLDIHADLNALLLEQAIPGNLLKEYYSEDIQNTIQIYGDVVKTLAGQSKSSDQYKHVEGWCRAIDRIDDQRISTNYIKKAKELRDFLFSTKEREYLCHGDLHLENIIQNGNQWLSIDPKGIIGEMAFEAAAFDLIDESEWSKPQLLKDKIIYRSQLLAATLDLDHDRLLSWIFLRAMMSAQWFIEDQGDPEKVLNVVSLIYPLLPESIENGGDHEFIQASKITEILASKLIAAQFPEYADLPVTAVEQQGHDHRSFRLGNDLLIRMPIAASYALKVPKEQELLPRLRPHLTLLIPKPMKMGDPSPDYPFPFSIYQWLEGTSANRLTLDDHNLISIAAQLAQFLKELHRINTMGGPCPGQHNWWRGDHPSVYDEGARKQIYALHKMINRDKAIALWEAACNTRWHAAPVWIHGDFASGNILIKNGAVSGIIDFGGLGVGDPACDLVIAWTLFKGKSREIFKEAMQLDHDTWLRAKAWCLWKASFELCEMRDQNNDEALMQRKIIDEILESFKLIRR